MEPKDENKITIAENLILDFTGLFMDDEPEESPAEGHISGLEDIPAKTLLQTQQRQAARQQTQEAYSRYQDNIIKSEELRSEILKGARAGADIYDLFLKAAEAISLMTSNRAFYSQLKADITTVYGCGQREPAPLKLELKEAQERLRRLREAERRGKDPDGQRVRAAIAAHQNRITELEKLISEAEETQL